MENTGNYSPAEEMANAITHGIGTVLAIAALAVLVVFAALRGSVWHIVTFSVYGTTLIVLYLFSTLYHSFTNQKLKAIFKVMDHSAIYLLIAGTYTPFTLIALRGPLGWTIFGFIWGLAIVGIILKVFFVKRFKVISTLTYVLMGWAIVVAFNPLLANLSGQGIRWLVSGGILYSAGAIFYLFKRIPYNHAIFHLFVIGGSVCHFLSILLYVLPITG
ncbi:PAQR family membrane homeostasis protein TrhA [Dethiobacter alkaliphilus]|uniref:Channel protein, hemolysin III family n=1 Tax=Dethiobacter alkaliphilus AHT 1 TaxID=555088 RepID=C0GCE9_DETAL|nr:channel protein, hemolysin III family [Dethiobacter alkaliphilus AHT 1]